jgi:hypothetical protein
MSIEEISETRDIKGFIVTVTLKGPMGNIASKILAKDITEFLDKIEMMEE